MIDPQTRGRITRKTKTNELVRAVNALLNMEGRDGIRVTVSDTNVLITLDGGGLPEGYGPEELKICVNGEIVDRNFLTDNPD